MSTNETRTGSSTYNIDKLTETNYRSWAQQLQWILDERNLWDIVNGTETRPRRPAAPSTSAGEGATTAPLQVDPAAMTEYETKLEDFVIRSKKARSTIGASISASIMVYIEGLTDPAEMWRILEEKYNPRTQTTLFQIIRQFMNVKMGEGDNMEKHLQNVQTLKRKCEEQGEEISDNLYTAILLNSVSEEYMIAVAILESQEELTPASILNRLMEEYRKVHGNGNGIKSRIALTAAATDGMANIECFYCGQLGHMKRECPVRKYRQEKYEDRNGESEEKSAPVKARITF
jgi:hypothetical protein